MFIHGDDDDDALFIFELNGLVWWRYWEMHVLQCYRTRVPRWERKERSRGKQSQFKLEFKGT